MAIFSPTSASAYPKPQPFPTFKTQNYSSLPFSLHPLRLLLVLPPPPPPCIRLPRFHSALSPQPPPPPPEKDPQATLSRLQDRVQIFLAVLFWMSLFFWASVWDGKNNGKK